jgi:hypothetical protein
MPANGIEPKLAVTVLTYGSARASALKRSFICPRTWLMRAFAFSSPSGTRTQAD